MVVANPSMERTPPASRRETILQARALAATTATSSALTSLKSSTRGFRFFSSDAPSNPEPHEKPTTRWKSLNYNGEAECARAQREPINRALLPDSY